MHLQATPVLKWQVFFFFVYLRAFGVGFLCGCGPRRQHHRIEEAGVARRSAVASR